MYELCRTKIEFVSVYRKGILQIGEFKAEDIRIQFVTL